MAAVRLVVTHSGPPPVLEHGEQMIAGVTEQPGVTRFVLTETLASECRFVSGDDTRVTEITVEHEKPPTYEDRPAEFFASVKPWPWPKS